ncbi:MAG: hypothetical protein ABIY90_08590 [Puia sp.]
MNVSRIMHFVLPFVLCCACHDKPETPPVQKDYFPVLDYLESEIAGVDSLPSKMTEYITRNGKTDSAILTLTAFNKLAAGFLLPGLDSNRFEKRFEENSFLDQTTNLLSFTYSTKDTSYGLRRVDVLAIPDPAGTDKVKSIYLESSALHGDTLILSKMFWNSGKSFSIIHIYQPAHGEAVTSQTKVVWNSSE